MVIAEYGSDAYRIVLALHILAAIVGFGAVFLNGLYLVQSRARSGTEGLAVLDANITVSMVGQLFIYAVFPLGFVLVLIGDDVFDFGQTWVWLSMTLYVVAVGVAHGMLWPRVRRLRALAAELAVAGTTSSAGAPDPRAQIETLSRQIAPIGGALDAMIVVITFLMVFKPGGPSL